MRLLVIEDESDIAHALVRGLRREGYAVDVAYDGEQGWQLAEINDYDLLILARSERSAQLPERSSIALGPLLEEVCSDLQATASARAVTLELHNDLDIVVQGDSTLLARAFSNLVENGIHYNRPAAG